MMKKKSNDKKIIFENNFVSKAWAFMDGLLLVNVFAKYG